jgi:hypothetical protein
MAVKKNILIGIVKSFIKIINMKKILLFVLITLTTVFVSNAQRNYSITRVQIKDPNSGSWSELMTYSGKNA